MGYIIPADPAKSVPPSLTPRSPRTPLLGWNPTQSRNNCPRRLGPSLTSKTSSRRSAIAPGPVQAIVSSPGYAKSARRRAPQAVICFDPYHVVQLANRALDDVRRAYWNELRQVGDRQAARRFEDARWSLLKKPEKLTDKQAATLRRLKAAGGEVWRGYTLKEATRGSSSTPSPSRTSSSSSTYSRPASPAAGSSRSSSSGKRSASTATGSSPRSASASTKAAPKRSTTRSA
jgi:hypothetical protein